jgi:DNA-binding MarR family transcriptional regulator
MPGQPRLDNGFWYDTSPNGQRRRAVAVLQAMRAYRAAEMSMRRRTRDAMAVGENDMTLLRYLLQMHHEGRFSSPGELARYLGVSTASMTAMIDRLERSGHVRRERHATDRRSIYVVPTERTEREMREALGEMHDRMLDAVVDMSPDETRTVMDMLARLQAVVDDVEPHVVQRLEENIPQPTAHR